MEVSSSLLTLQDMVEVLPDPDLPSGNRTRIDVRILDETGDETCQGRQHTPEEIINKLREAEVVIAAGSTVAEAARRIGVSEQTFYRWRSEYGGLRVDQARRLRQLETENSRLKRAVAELTLDNQILKEAAGGNF